MGTSFLWLLLFTGLLLVSFRWVLTRSTAIINRQAVRQLFLQRLAATCPNLHITHEDEHSYSMEIDGLLCTMHLDQLFRRCAESPAQTGVFVRQAVRAFADALQDTDAVSAQWEQFVVPLLVRTDLPTPPDLLLRPIVDSLAIGYALNTGTVFRWLTREVINQAGIDEAHLHAIALRNLERSCNMLVIESPQLDAGGRERFLRFLTADGLDAARVLLPSFYQRFSMRFDDSDLLVAIPSRDSLAIISTNDHALASMLAWRNARERLQRAYPLYPHLLRVSATELAPWTPGGAAQA